MVIGRLAAMTVEEDFASVAAQFRGELLAYCYRMLGSIDEAEDLVQETYLRAWRSFGGFEGRASARTWLYRIATNACLTALERRARRPLPAGLGAPDEDPAAPLVAGPEVPWLQPFPGAPAGSGERADPGDPAAAVVAREGIRLAFVAALQYLSARQRAVLIMRDVLDWPAAEAADLLGMTTTAVNSALRRARDQIAAALPAGSDAADVTGLAEPADPARRALLDRYAAAIENADASALAGLLREDIALEMPPLLTWFAGRDTVLRFVAASLLPGPGLLRLVPVTANGQPGFAVYERGPDGDVPRARDPGPHGHGHRHRPDRRLRQPVPVRPVRPAPAPPAPSLMPSSGARGQRGPQHGFGVAIVMLVHCFGSACRVFSVGGRGPASAARETSSSGGRAGACRAAVAGTDTASSGGADKWLGKATGARPATATARARRQAGNVAGKVAVRDTKDRDSAVLTFAPQAWREFAAKIKTGG